MTTALPINVRAGGHQQGLMCLYTWGCFSMFLLYPLDKGFVYQRLNFEFLWSILQPLKQELYKYGFQTSEGSPNLSKGHSSLHPSIYKSKSPCTIFQGLIVFGPAPQNLLCSFGLQMHQ